MNCTKDAEPCEKWAFLNISLFTDCELKRIFVQAPGSTLKFPRRSTKIPMIRKSVFCLTVFFAIAMVGSGFAQSSLTDTARAAVGVNPESGPVKSLGPQARHAVVSDLIEEDSGTSGPSSIKGNPGGLPGILSVPNFTRSFTFGGQDFPYTMMGNDPSLGHKTIVPTKFIAVSLELQNADLVTTTTVPVGEFEQ